MPGHYKTGTGRKIITKTIRETIVIIIIRTIAVADGIVSPLSRVIFTLKRPSRVRRIIIVTAPAKPTSDVVLRAVVYTIPYEARGRAHEKTFRIDFTAFYIRRTIP